tara:strand:- start:1076 stop:1198 length:123 start_codon:yes stop_codon:yes gene_type:complete
MQIKESEQKQMEKIQLKLIEEQNSKESEISKIKKEQEDET